MSNVHPIQASYDANAVKASAEVEGERLVAREVMRLAVRDKAQERYRAMSNPRPGLRLLTDTELLARPDPEWWVEGLVQKGTVCEVAGPPGLGKSFFALHLARSMASGFHAFGRAVSAGRVLYVVAEGASAFGKRGRAWDDYHRRTVPQGSLAYLESGVNLSIEESVTELRELFFTGGFDVLVLDTYSQLSGVLDENSAAENARVLNALRSIRETREGATVMLIHHTDARGTKARGSTTLTANVDTVIMLKPSEGGFSVSTKLEDGGKQKDGMPERVHGFKLEDHLGTAVVTFTGKMPQSPYWALVREALSDGEWVTGSDLRKACGIEEASGAEYDKWKALVASTVRDKLVIKEGERRSARYKLVPLIASAPQAEVGKVPDWL